MSKQEMFAGVEVFEVGVQQLKDFIESGRLYRPVLNSAELVCAGTYAIVYRSECFGGSAFSMGPNVVCGYVQGELEAAIPSQVLECGNWTVGRDVEIWRLVDDGDLWQVWDHDSAKACKDGGQPTDYHVYDGRVCVLDLVREVPSMLYAVTVVDDADQVVSSDWYGDADKWADAVSFANVNGNKFMSLEHQSADELGVYVVDDWCCDEGLADGVTVLNAYYRDYRSE